MKIMFFLLIIVFAYNTWTFAASPSDVGDRDLAGLNELIHKYSRQQIFTLNEDESYQVKLKNGVNRSVQLVSITEHRDSVNNMISRVDIRILIDRKPLTLICAPYVKPTVINGLRIQADTTSGFVDMPKKVQFSAWDASDPIVDTKMFRFPIPDYRLFSHATQAFNEPVHLGLGDGDPTGQKFYHNYGMDMAGYEGGEDVISATEGDIIFFWPSREDLCSVVVEDKSGFTWEYAHLSSILPEIVLGAHVKRGQKIGVIGKTGPSGNFSHLHLGSFLSRTDMESGKENKRLNLYPWLVTAYQSTHPKSVYAIARPHQLALTGEKVTLDASNSMAFGTKIISYKWTLPDGKIIHKSKTDVVFDSPGTYTATLYVKGKNGVEDVDFCHIRVFSKMKPEDHMPTIFMTYTPTESIRIGQPVKFRFWFQGANPGVLSIDFGDGSKTTSYQSYDVISHSFAKKGIYIVTASCVSDGKTITNKLKLVVSLPQ